MTLVQITEITDFNNAYTVTIEASGDALYVLQVTSEMIACQNGGAFVVKHECPTDTGCGQGFTRYVKATFSPTYTQVL